MATPLHTEHTHLSKAMTASPMLYSSSATILGSERSSYYPLSSPPLQPPLLVVAPEKPSKDTKLAMQEIAKEALRLTKETLAHDYTQFNTGA